MTRSLAVLSRFAATRTAQQYGPVVLSLAAAGGLSLILRGYLYPRPLFLLALVLSIWGRGLGPGLVGAGLATMMVRFLFPELLPSYGLVSDSTVFGLAAVSISAFSSTKLRAEKQRKQAEAALRRTEERFRATFYQAAVGIAQTDLDGKWLLLNDRFCEILGYTQAELRGKTFLDITHPDDREASLGAIRRLLAGEIASHSMEKRYVRRDGAIVWGRLFLSLVRDQDNLPRYFISVVEDVTEKIQAERALRDSERRLTLAQSAGHLVLWERDLRTNVIVSSGEHARLYGVTPDHPQLKYEEWLRRVHPDDRELVQAAVRKAVEQTRVWDAEFRVLWPDGSVHWLYTKGTVFFDDSGQPVRLAGVNFDITERKQTEAALLESEQRFRNMADTAPVLIWVAGPDKLRTFFNKGWLDFTGKDMDQELGNGWADRVHPEDLDHCYATYSSSFDARRTFRMEYRLRRADGEYRWVLDDGVPLYRGDEFGGYIGSCIDVTEQRLTQDRLRTSERRLNAIISSIPGAVWETSGSPDNPAKQVKFMSNQVEQMLGYSVEQWMTTPGLWPLIVHPDDRSRFMREAIEIFTSDKGSGSHQYRCLTKDGRTVWVESHASAIREKTGTPIGLRGVTIDITERKEAQTALVRAQEELARVTRVIGMGELAVSIAHEINQPLAAVVTNGEACLRFLAASAPNIEKAKDILTSIISDANRASEVIRRIRALFAKASGQKEMFDLNQLIRDTILLLEEYAQRHNVLIRTNLEESLPAVFGDRTQLRQLLLNLVMNGIEATGRDLHGARLVVIMTGSDAPPGIQLEVSDSGIGIQPGDRERIFHPFFTTKEAGLGMGLSISRTIVESHGGRILVEPNQPHGTRFLVFLPNERMGATRSATSHR